MTENLIDFLMRNRHTSPFEMCEIQFHIKLPLFVMRQWIRHRTANVNEKSARYCEMEDEFYIPSAEHIGVQSKSNRQCRVISDQKRDQKKININIKKILRLSNKSRILVTRRTKLFYLVECHENLLELCFLSTCIQRYFGR